MATPFISAFSQIRLSGAMVNSTTDSRLRVGGATTMMVSDSGAFTSAAVVQNTGQQLTVSLNSLSGWAGSAASVTTVANNLTLTGVALGASIASLSGWTNTTFLPRGSIQSYVTGLASGSDSYNVTFPTGFASKPRVSVELEVFTPVIYGHVVGPVTAAGFTLYLSDTIAETGVYAHVSAQL